MILCNLTTEGITDDPFIPPHLLLMTMAATYKATKVISQGLLKFPHYSTIRLNNHQPQKPKQTHTHQQNTTPNNTLLQVGNTPNITIRNTGLLTMTLSFSSR